MAVSLYMGVMGSGKSYEVVSSVIVPAYSRGRRVVTNITGINEDLIKQYCLDNFNEQELGEIVFVNSKEVLNDNFFPYYSDDESEKDKLAAIETVCRYGDLICLDELWSIWPSENKIPEQHKRFISMHRHMSNVETGVSCDLVIINQSNAELPRYVRDRVQTTFKMTKLTSLGFNKNYRVDVFTGAKTFKSNKIQHFIRRYDKKIFPLYKSYESANGKEVIIDKRQSLFSSKLLWVKLGFFIALLIICIFLFINAWQGFNSGGITRPEDEPSHNERTVPINEKEIPHEQKILSSKTWKIAGVLRSDYVSQVIIVDTVGRYRFIPSNRFENSGLSLSGIVDNEVITYYSGDIK
ncbi:TPA: hypothetical protein PXN84_004316 [Yersinia enterocolitica]|nr:hypothetical protein [Yersinia enterocolitica]HDL7434330.1 hypothetical protein [Yersinia enterocolitica]HDL7476779.1 hypothetical protein [Yersinia enterocolitica]